MELRKDYLLNRYVIISTERAKRPQQFVQKKMEVSTKEECPFCPGNEKLLPGIIEELKKDNNWIIRVVPNKYAVVSMNGDPIVRTDNKFFTFASAYGCHEVIIETPEHNKELEDLPLEHIKEVIRMYISRIKILNNNPNVKCVTIFKNRGETAGASISHSHTQLIAYNVLPAAIENELEKSYEYFIKNESCPFCEIINIEKNSYRRVFEDEHFVSFTPYASRFPFEIWIFPKKHKLTITMLDEEEIKSLAGMLKKILNRLDTLNYPPFNIEIHNGEPNSIFHFYIEISPRLSTWAGFEISTEIIINSVSPEDAAKFYRGETN